jgi:hypothetical protein
MSIEMARLYEKAWHDIYHKQSQYRKDAIIAEPHGRIAAEVAKEAAKLAESRELELQTSPVSSGTF